MGNIPDEHPLPPNHPISRQVLADYAHYLMGEAVQWSKLDMLDYAGNPGRRLGWEWRVAQAIRMMEAELVSDRAPE